MTLCKSKRKTPINFFFFLLLLLPAEISHKTYRLDRYKELIRGLPRVNRTTLAALISHLFRSVFLSGPL